MASTSGITENNKAPSTWAPASFVAQVHGLHRRAFLDDFGGIDFLLVRVQRTDDPVARGLALSAHARNESQRAREQVEPCTVDVLPSMEIIAACVPGLLVEEPHFVVPIQKRGGAGEELCVRVGRGHENDVVLRDRSVSKLHALLHLDQVGALALSDAGSHNQTYLNDEPILGRVELAPGDCVRFGRVAAVVASAPQIWAMLHARSDAARFSPSGTGGSGAAMT